ncbi:MAG: DUF4175 family protein [Balneolales bacterium]|nr:DUF4175 family protein [Balneolales bacterium]
MQDKKDIIQEINHYQNLVDKAWSKALINRKLALFFSGLTGFMIVFAVLMLLEHQAYLSPLLKSSLWVAASAVAAIGAYLVYQKLPKLEKDSFYRRITRETELQQMRYLLDLGRLEDSSNQVFRDTAILQNLEVLRAHEQHPDSKPEVRIQRWLWNFPGAVYFRKIASVAGGVFAIILLISLFRTDAAVRSITFWGEFERPNPFEYSIDPGNIAVEQGSRISIEATFTGDQPETVALALRSGVEERFRTIQMEQTRSGRFVSPPQEIFNDTEYRVLMDDFQSPIFSLEVQQTPRFRELIAEVTPPAYTGRESERFTYPFSRIEVPEGSEIELRATANKPIALVSVLRAKDRDSDEPAQSMSALTEEQQSFSYTFTATDPDTLSFRLTDDEGLLNRNPFSFNLRVIRDQAPTVRIIRPEAVIQKLNPRELEIQAEARDDYGLSSIHLRYELRPGFGGDVRRGNVRISGRAPASTNIRYSWDVSELQMQAADEVVYWIEVFDNDEINGFKSAVSARQTLRASSLAESIMQQEEQEDDLTRRLDELSRQQDQAREELQQLRDNIIQNPNESWEQQQMTDEMKQQQERMSEQLQQLQEEFDRMSEEMMNDSVISEETRQRYEDLQQLMSEIDDPEILELLEKLRESLENMDQNQIREALENLEFNEQSYRERLERTLELFKQLRLELDLDRASALLEELAQQEERLMEMDNAGDQQQQQEAIQEELDKLRERLEQLPEKSPQRRMQMVEELSEQMGGQMDEVQQKIDENLQELQSGDPDQERSKQQQSEIRDQLKEMSEQLSMARSSMQQQQLEINIAALRSIFQSMITLSEAQEDLNIETLQLEPNSIAFVRQARLQRNISANFSIISDSLMQVAKEIPQFTNAALRYRLEVERSLEQSVDFLRERNKNQATTAERIGLGGLNQLGGMIADLLEQLDEMDGEGGGGGGMDSEQMMQQMEQMGEMQQQLNQQIQDFINDMAGDRLTQDQMERLDQMARQQNEIRQQVEQLQRSGNFRQGDRILSELQRLAEQMEDTINDIRGGSTDELLVERQQNILNRMLETQRSMDRQDESEERLGISAEDVERSDPPELTLEELEREIRNRLQDPNQTRFTDDYQQLIRMYFQILQEIEGQEILMNP